MGITRSSAGAGETGKERPATEPERISSILGRVLAQAFVAAIRDPELRDAVRELRGTEQPSTSSMLTATELAQILNVSVATIRRLDPPAVVVGDASSRRYSLEEVRRWLRSRQPKPTTPIAKPATNEDLDVSDVLSSVGLRAVGGGKR